jgi:hypothetical protein
MSPLRTVIALAGVAVAGGTAHSATVVTPVLFPGTADQAFCIVLNAGPKDIEVGIEIVNAITGTVHAGGGPASTVPPGLIDFTNDQTPVPSYCRVTTPSAKRVRVTLCMEDGNGNCAATVTVP